MFCTKCGKEIFDEAIMCPHCGCATSNYNRAAQPQQQSSSSIYSENYPALKAFSDQAKSLQTLGIIAAILCFGIGIFFSIVIWVKQGFKPQETIPEFHLTLPNEIAEYEAAKKRWIKAGNLATIPVLGIIAGIGIGIAIGALMTL